MLFFIIKWLCIALLYRLLFNLNMLIGMLAVGIYLYFFVKKKSGGNTRRGGIIKIQPGNDIRPYLASLIKINFSKFSETSKQSITQNLDNDDDNPRNISTEQKYLTELLANPDKSRELTTINNNDSSEMYVKVLPHLSNHQYYNAIPVLMESINKQCMRIYPEYTSKTLVCLGSYYKILLIIGAHLRKSTGIRYLIQKGLQVREIERSLLKDRNISQEIMINHCKNLIDLYYSLKNIDSNLIYSKKTLHKSVGPEIDDIDLTSLPKSLSHLSMFYIDRQQQKLQSNIFSGRRTSKIPAELERAETLLLADQIKSAYENNGKKLAYDGDLKSAIIESKKLIRMGKNVSKDIDLINSSKINKFNRGRMTFQIFLQLFAGFMGILGTIMIYQIFQIPNASSSTTNFAIIPFIFAIFAYVIQTKL